MFPLIGQYFACLMSVFVHIKFEYLAELLLPHRCNQRMPEKPSLVLMSQPWKPSSMSPSSTTEPLWPCLMAGKLVRLINTNSALSNVYVECGICGICGIWCSFSLWLRDLYKYKSQVSVVSYNVHVNDKQNLSVITMLCPENLSWSDSQTLYKHYTQMWKTACQAHI